MEDEQRKKNRFNKEEKDSFFNENLDDHNPQLIESVLQKFNDYHKDAVNIDLKKLETFLKAYLKENPHKKSALIDFPKVNSKDEKRKLIKNGLVERQHKSLTDVPWKKIFEHPKYPTEKDPDNGDWKTEKDLLNDVLIEDPGFLGYVPDFVPDADLFILLTVREMKNVSKKISEKNLVEANKKAQELVTKHTDTFYDKFLDELDQGNPTPLLTNSTKPDFSFSRDDLKNKIKNEIADFITRRHNSLVSIAGTVNELLLVKALEDAGLKKETHFIHKPSSELGDISIENTGGVGDALRVEVKSYKARERLARGLKEIQSENKIGVGFFNDHAEFTKGHTLKLLRTGASAVYLPKVTMARIAEDALAIPVSTMAAAGSRLYRELETFASDMQYYNEHGTLPARTPKRK